MDWAAVIRSTPSVNTVRVPAVELSLTSLVVEACVLHDAGGTTQHPAETALPLFSLATLMQRHDF